MFVRHLSVLVSDCGPSVGIDALLRYFTNAEIESFVVYCDVIVTRRTLTRRTSEREGR